jgi:hypothetical protein
LVQVFKDTLTCCFLPLFFFSNHFFFFCKIFIHISFFNLCIGKLLTSLFFFFFFIYCL